MPFKKQSANGVDLWTGDPDCQHAHETLLTALAVFGNFIGPTQSLGTRRQGNLGEFISLHVATGPANLQHSKAYAINAFDPLQDVSSPGLDITYAYFDAEDEDRDRLYVQEVKTTGEVSLSYADTLVTDYEKLFGEDPNLTLGTRVQAIAMRVELGEKEPMLANRLRRLASTQPKTCTHIRLVPTLVHELKGTSPQKKLLAVASAISTLGWPMGSINPWGIALTDLVARLGRMARGQV